MADPIIWGKYIWYALHYISLGYPDNPSNNDKEKYKAFFLLLKDVLPCKICADHYNNNLKILPLTDDILSNKEKFINWVIDLHNIVNEITGKPKLNYDQSKQLISKDIKCDHTNNNLYYLAIIMIIILIIIIIYKKN